VIEPRVKLLTMLALLLAAAFVRHAPVLVALYGVTLVLAAGSQLRLSFFVRRVWLFVPLFTGLVVAPATLNLVTHGQIVVPLGTWFGHPVGLTRQGLDAAALIVSRVAVEPPARVAPGAVRAPRVRAGAGHDLPVPVPPGERDRRDVHRPHRAHGPTRP
jgi:hypothetical protein